ncbi:MAG: hypothetical protein EBU01_08890 [Crocinitomicaceae bacterium]|nr:hypothetical protein [Crocinitomicaceae bacterium]
MLAVSMSISAKTNTKVIANSAPGIRYNAFAIATVTPIVEIKPIKNNNKNLKSLFKQTNKEQKKLRLKQFLSQIQKRM